MLHDTILALKLISMSLFCKMAAKFKMAANITMNLFSNMDRSSILVIKVQIELHSCCGYLIFMVSKEK